jgi:Flp pilus assembly protein TadD
MMKNALLSLAVLAAVGVSGPSTFAAGGSLEPTTPIPTAPENPDFSAGKAAIEVKNYQAAIDAFGKFVAKEPNNPNGQNMLAYAYRRSGQLDLAFRHYNEALRIDPKHRGAHEYIGEAYLMSGNLAKAEEHLKLLDDLCFFGCEEYTMLKKAVAEHKQKTATR